MLIDSCWEHSGFLFSSMPVSLAEKARLSLRKTLEKIIFRSLKLTDLFGQF